MKEYVQLKEVSSFLKRKELYIDISIYSALLDALAKNPKYKKKIRIILSNIEEGNNNPNLYQKNYVGRVSAMKFNQGKDNMRIYCQDHPDKIILCHLLPKKKDQKVSKTLMRKLSKIDTDEYKEFKV